MVVYECIICNYVIIMVFTLCKELLSTKIVLPESTIYLLPSHYFVAFNY
jgi:hypothetical protein